MSGKQPDAGGSQKVLPTKFLRLHANDIFAFGNWRLQLVVLRIEKEVLQTFVREKFPSGNHVLRRDGRAVGVARIRIDTEPVSQLIRLNLPVSSQHRHVFQRCWVQRKQRLVDQPGDRIVDGSVPFRAGHPKSARKIDYDIADCAPLHCPWIPNQIELRIRFPTLSRESLPSLFGRNRRVGAGIGIGKDGVVVLVHGDGGRPGGGS